MRKPPHQPGRRRDAHYGAERSPGVAAYRFTVPKEHVELIAFLNERRRTGHLPSTIVMLLLEYHRKLKARMTTHEEAEGGINQ